MALQGPTGIPYDPRADLPPGVPATGVNGCFQSWNRVMELLADVVPLANGMLVSTTTELV